MMITSRLGECPKCAEWRERYESSQKQVAELEKRLALMEDKVGRLYADLTKANARVQQLQEALAGRSKDSTNSSKPPSSDIVKPQPEKPAEGPRERRRGGQVGHAPQQRAAFQPDEIDAVQLHQHESCPQCGGPVVQLDTPADVVQQIELVAKPTLVTEHRSCTCRCGKCQKDFTQPIPPEVAAAGTFGPRLTAFVAYLKGSCHASYGTIQQLLQETCGTAIARGTLVNLCQKVSRSLQPSYDALLKQVPKQDSLHIDETSHHENGKLFWTWVFRAPQFTLFHIDPTRSAKVLDQILGTEFCGTLLADYYSAYRHYLRVQPRADAQFCLGHLIRDVKFLDKLPEPADRQFGQELLGELKTLFQLWHSRPLTADEAENKTFRATLIAQGQQLERVAIERAPETKAACRLARRFRKHAAQYLRFTQVPNLEPTNNAAEQAIRYVVIDRRVTQGTRSERGRTWCQRIWTTIATCRQHGRDLLSFLEQSLRAMLTDKPPPSLLPAP
jgi:transposase